MEGDAENSDYANLGFFSLAKLAQDGRSRKDQEDPIMSELPANQPDYGNWVSAKLVYIPGVLCLLFAALSFALPALIILALLFFLGFAYFAYARVRFSQKGGDVQARIQDLVLDHLDWDGNGEVLDIGCGNAPLAIKVARKYPHAKVTGVDYWGQAWEYAKGVCERNAAIEGVAERVTFQQSSASRLPFGDESFDVAVSTLVFHEVRDAADKRQVVKEALRVVRKGGRFVFQDLFLWKQVYGDVDALLDTIKSWGIEQVEFVDTSRSAFIPRALKLPFMVGTIGILYLVFRQTEYP
jgi:SAM-dependent methyltransferase